VFLYDAGVALTDHEPQVANATGRVEFWWNDLVAEPNAEPVADSPWSRTVDVSRPGRFCVTLLETSGSASDWTVMIRDKS
jgi:hypothetical protein